MKHMTILAVVMGSLFLGACSSSTDAPSDSKRLRLEGVVEGCKEVQSICTASEPPTCFDYCADEDPGSGGGDCQPIGGAYESCGDTPCAVGVDAKGTEFEVCYPPDCVVSFDAETKTETVSCPPGTSPSPGGSEPGDPGSGGGSEPGDPGSAGGAEPGSPGSEEPKGL